jgi:hypothetical protein
LEDNAQPKDGFEILGALDEMKFDPEGKSTEF